MWWQQQVKEVRSAGWTTSPQGIMSHVTTPKPPKLPPKRRPSGPADWTGLVVLVVIILACWWIAHDPGALDTTRSCVGYSYCH